MSLELVKNALGRRRKMTQIPLERDEYNDLLNEYRKAKKITFATLLASMKRKGVYFPQPVRTQPSLATIREHPEWSISKKMAKMTAADVKSWGPRVIADVKFDGVRGLLYVNPTKKEVKLYSRRLKELHKLEDAYAESIIENLSGITKGETVLDTEIYAVGKDGKLLEYGTVAGWARNPSDEKYNSLTPTIEAFDVVMLNGKDIRDLPLKFRKSLLEITTKRRDGVILDIADTRLMKNHPRPIEWRFKAIIEGKGEGLVLKKEDSLYFYGKPKPDAANPWRKVKAADTLDLELKALEISPREGPFEDYRHWIMVPNDDEEHEIRANKGIKAAVMDNSFYRAFSLDMINQWKSGRLVGSNEMISVKPELREYYGVDKVPARLEVPRVRRSIVEIFVEKMSKNYQPSGTKIVGIRDDKKTADTMSDVKRLGDFLLAVEEK